MDFIKEISKFSTATLHEALGQIGNLPYQIKPLYKKMKVCGPAYTLKAKANMNINFHRAYAYAKAGDARQAEMQGPAAWQVHRQALEEHAGRCRCGGHFRVGAPARCPKCRSTDYREDPEGHSILYD